MHSVKKTDLMDSLIDRSITRQPLSFVGVQGYFSPLIFHLFIGFRVDRGFFRKSIVEALAREGVFCLGNSPLITEYCAH